MASERHYNLSGLKKRLLNKSEERTYSEITSVEHIKESDVFSKIRIADVLRIENSGVTADLYSYALKAHFDFVIADKNLEPIFAIEFDGPSHIEPEQIQRDQKKIALCELFDFPILRINDRYLERSYRVQMSLLRWIIDVYFLQEGFHELQEKGHIPLDEIFDPAWVITNSNSMDKKDWWPYQIGIEARLRLQDYHKKGLIHDPTPNGAIGYSKDGVMKGFEFIRVSEDVCVYIESGMRNYKFPILLSDLFDELLIITLEQKVKKYIHDKSGSITLAEAQDKARLFAQNNKLGSCHSVGGLNPVLENIFKKSH
jgi:hypothetical protein